MVLIFPDFHLHEDCCSLLWVKHHRKNFPGGTSKQNVLINFLHRNIVTAP